MTAKTTTAKKTAGTPAKATAAQPRKRATTPAARRTRKTAQTKPQTDDGRIATVTDLRKPLPARPLPADKYTLHQLREARAALVAAQLGFRVPVLAWTTGIEALAYARLADGTILAHTGGQAPFTAYVPCRMGSHHAHPVTGPALLHAARVDADDCDTPHADFTDWSGPAARDLAAAFGGRRTTDAPEAVTQVLPLADMPRQHPDVDTPTDQPEETR